MLRWANIAPDAQNVTFVMAASEDEQVRVQGGAKVWTLSSADPGAANTPGEPTRISPVSKEVASFTSGSVLEVPGYSYTVIQLQLA